MQVSSLVSDVLVLDASSSIGQVLWNGGIKKEKEKFHTPTILAAWQRQVLSIHSWQALLTAVQSWLRDRDFQDGMMCMQCTR